MVQPYELNVDTINLPNKMANSELIARGFTKHKERLSSRTVSGKVVNAGVFERLVVSALREAGIHPIYHRASIQPHPIRRL